MLRKDAGGGTRPSGKGLDTPSTLHETKKPGPHTLITSTHHSYLHATIHIVLHLSPYPPPPAVHQEAGECHVHEPAAQERQGQGQTEQATKPPEKRRQEVARELAKSR